MQLPKGNRELEDTNSNIMLVKEVIKIPPRDSESREVLKTPTQ